MRAGASVDKLELRICGGAGLYYRADVDVSRVDDQNGATFI